MTHPHLTWYGCSVVLACVATAPVVAHAVLRACERTGTPHKLLAYWLGMSQAQLSHALAGEKHTHLPLDKFDGTSPEYRAAFLEELALTWGISGLLVTARDVLAVLRSYRDDASARRVA